MSTILTGDTHFRPDKSSEIVGDCAKALSELTRVCLEDYEATGDTALIIAGDLFDVKTPPAHVVAMVKSFVEHLQSKNIAVWGIQGNHELNRVEPWLTVLGINSLSEEAECVTICGHRVYGMDYQKPDILLPALQAIPEDTQILVLHQALKDALSFVSSTGDQSWDMVKDDVPGFVRLVLMGDIHITKSYVNATTLFAYPGTVYQKTLDESPNKYVIRVTPQCGIEFVPLQTRKTIQYLISSNEEAKAVFDIVEATPADPFLPTLYVLTYYADVEDALAYISRMQELTHVHVLAKPSHRAGEEAEQQTASIDGYHLHEYVGEFIDREKDPGGHNFLHRFLVSPDKKSFLVDFKEDIINGDGTIEF